MYLIGKRVIATIAVLIGMVAILSGCGGGSAGGSGTTGNGDPIPQRTLSWNPPTTYADNSSLNPSTDLATYEIYVNETGGFTDADLPVASAAAVDSGTGQVITSFNLSNLASFLSRGVNYQVSIRAVTILGAKSAFSQEATFSL